MAAVTITVNPVNDPPLAVNDSSYATDEETTAAERSANGGVLANDTDVEGDPLTAVLVRSTATRHGDLERRRHVQLHAGR